MYANSNSSRRETVVTVALAILFGSGIFLFGLLLMDSFLIALLATVAAVALVGALHYFVWGRSLARTTAAGRMFSRPNGMPERMPPPEPGASPMDRGRRPRP